jgi:hypothetical protein
MYAPGWFTSHATSEPASAIAAKPYEPKTLQSFARALETAWGSGSTVVRFAVRSQSETRHDDVGAPASHATSEPCSASATIVRFVSRTV